jgi:hypothetical protein
MHRRLAGIHHIPCLLLAVIQRVFHAALRVFKAAGDQVLDFGRLLFRGRPQAPAPVLDHAPGLFPALRREQQRQARAQQRSPNERSHAAV